MPIPPFFLASGSLVPPLWPSLRDYRSACIIRALEATPAYPTLGSAQKLLPVILTGGAVLAWFIGWQWYVKEKYPLSANSPVVLFAYKQGYLDEFNGRVFLK